MKKMMVMGCSMMAAILLQGCASIVLPPKLKAEQAEIIKSSHIPLSAAVDTKGGFYSEYVMQSMQNAHLFSQIDTIDKLPDADLVISMNGWVYSDGSNIPFWSLISFGIIPTVSKDDYRVRVKIQKNNRVQDMAVYAGYTYSSVSVMGWICVPLNLLPDRATSEWYEAKRFNQQLIYAIVMEKEDIVKLCANQN